MPKGPREEHRPAGVIGAAVAVIDTLSTNPIGARPPWSIRSANRRAHYGGFARVNWTHNLATAQNSCSPDFSSDPALGKCNRSRVHFRIVRDVMLRCSVRPRLLA